MKTTKQYLLIQSKFPRIASNFDFLWGAPEFSDYVYKLIEDTRENTRQGFPSDVFFAILDIQELHDQEFPHYARKYLDIWELNNGK